MIFSALKKKKQQSDGQYGDFLGKGSGLYVERQQKSCTNLKMEAEPSQSLQGIFSRQSAVFPLRSDLLLLEGQFTYLQYFSKSYLSIMHTPTLRGLPRLFSGKESTCHCRRCRRCGFHPSVGNTPRRQIWQHTSVFLSGKFHGHRNVVGYSPWGCRELDMTAHICKQASILLGAT